MRRARLLVPVRAVSGAEYPVGTEVRLAGGGAHVDAWVGGDWLALSWWEFTEQRDDAGRGGSSQAGRDPAP